MLSFHRNVLIAILYVVLMFIIYTNVKAFRRRSILNQDLRKAMEKLELLESKILSTAPSNYDLDYEERKYIIELNKVGRANWEKTLEKYNEYMKKNTLLNNNLDTIFKNRDKALKKSNLSTEKKILLKKIRDDNRKKTLIAKVSKIQDNIAKKTYKIIPDSYFF